MNDPDLTAICFFGIVNADVSIIKNGGYNISILRNELHRFGTIRQILNSKFGYGLFILTW